jgi:ribosomal protein S1
MVQSDQFPNKPEEPPDLGDSWWKAALSEGEAELSAGCDPVEKLFTDIDPRPTKLSHPENDWDYVDRLYQEDEIIRLRVVGCNQGGLLVQGENIN